MSFKKDKRDGDEGENIVKKLLTKCKIKSKKNTDKNNLSDFDLDCITEDKKTFTVEVKHDIYAAKSGNIAIEIYNPQKGKDSGLMATKADLWIHIADEGVYCTSTKELKKFVDNHIPKRIIHHAGDGNATIYLYEMMPSIFHRLDTLKSKEILGIIKKCLKK